MAGGLVLWNLVRSMACCGLMFDFSLCGLCVERVARHLSHWPIICYMEVLDLLHSHVPANSYRGYPLKYIIYLVCPPKVLEPHGIR